MFTSKKNEKHPKIMNHSFPLRLQRSITRFSQGLIGVNPGNFLDEVVRDIGCIF